jgi:hypothetical protein
MSAWSRKVKWSDLDNLLTFGLSGSAGLYAHGKSMSASMRGCTQSSALVLADRP